MVLTSSVHANFGIPGHCAYAAAKGRIYHHDERACVYNVQDPWTERLVREADVLEGARAVGFTLGPPEPGMVGLVDDVLDLSQFDAFQASMAGASSTEVAAVGVVTPDQM